MARNLDECIFNNKDTIHYIKGDYKVQPDCKKCDGFGVDARRYKWNCYVSYRMELKKREQIRLLQENKR